MEVTHNTTNGASVTTSAKPEQPRLISYIATGMVRGLLPVTAISGPLDVYYLRGLGSFLLEPTSSLDAARLDLPKPCYYTIAAVMAPDEERLVSISAFVQQTKAGRTQYRYIKLSGKTYSRLEEAQLLCPQQSASPEHIYLRAEDVSRPSGDGRLIEYVELGYGGILPADARAVATQLRREVSQYGWEPHPLLTYSISEVIAYVQAAGGPVPGWNGEGFEGASNSTTIGA